MSGGTCKDLCYKCMQPTEPTRATCADCDRKQDELDAKTWKKELDDAYARGKADGMAEANIAQMLSDSFAHGKDAELAKVVAWLHGPLPGVTMCRCGHVNVQDIIDALERGEHKK